MPLLSRGAGCVAAWHSGIGYGPSLTSDGSLNDFISGRHHAAFPGGSNNPLLIAPALGAPYLYLPGSSGNSATITLANSTAYFYTITYHDLTTATDTQTSTGAGLLTFGGTDAKFAGLKIARLQITTDADHGTVVSDIQFNNSARYNATVTSLTDESARTVTINRSATGRKSSVPLIPGAGAAPLYLFGVDDYDTTVSDASLEPRTGSMSAAVLIRHYGSPPDGVLGIALGKKSSAGTVTAGWDVGVGASGALYAFRVSDGSTQAIPTTNRSDHPDGSVLLMVGVFDRPNRLASLYCVRSGKATSGSAAASITGSVTNSLTLRSGQYDVGSTVRTFEGEIFAKAVWSRVLTATDVQRLAHEWRIF